MLRHCIGMLVIAAALSACGIKGPLKPPSAAIPPQPSTVAPAAAPAPNAPAPAQEPPPPVPPKS